MIIVALYEALANLSSALILGIAIGIISATMIAGLLMNFAELPFVLTVSFKFAKIYK